MQNRLRSKVLWVSIFALFYFVLKNWFNVEIPQWDVFVELLLSCISRDLVLLTIPTDKDNF